MTKLLHVSVPAFAHSKIYLQLVANIFINIHRQTQSMKHEQQISSQNLPLHQKA